MSQFRNLFVEFSGDPSNDKELYKRYCSSEKFEPLSLSDEVIHFVEIAALEAAQKEIEQLKSIFSVQLDILEQNKQLTAALKVAEDAIEREMKWRTVKYCTNDGLDNLREALNEIQKIKKGLG